MFYIVVENFRKIDEFLRQKMKRIFGEQFVLFTSVLKWILLATITGVIVGLSTAVFLKVLDLSTQLQGDIIFTSLSYLLAY